MKLHMIAQNRPAASRRAVVLCCDRAYLPFASLTLWSVLRTTPLRDFDLCLVSTDEVVLPDVLAAGNIRVCHVSDCDTTAALPVTGRVSKATFLRLGLAGLLGQDYDRILYLDSDTLVVGSQIDRLLDAALHGAPIAAVMDVAKIGKPGKPLIDQARLGLNGPYFNAGVILFDCAVYSAQRVAEDCMRALQDHGPDMILLQDQTLLNLVLQGRWAALNMAWNWQFCAYRPYFEHEVDLQIVHFHSAHKPWSDPGAKLPIRYRSDALRFLAAHFPEVPTPAADGERRLNPAKLAARLIRHAAMARRFARAFNMQGSDILRVTPPDQVRAP